MNLLPDPIRKLIRHFLLLPPIRWFIPEHHRRMMELSDIMEQKLSMARQELMRRVAADPTLLQRLREAGKADAQLRPRKH